MNLNKRIGLAEQDLKHGEKVVVYIVEDRESAQFRYRCNNIMKAVGDNGYRIVWFLTSEITRIEELRQKIDLVVIVRQAVKNGRILKFIKKVRSSGIRVLFDLDDLVFDLRDLTILMRGTNGLNMVAWASYVWRVQIIAKRVDGFITTNEFLARKLERSFKKPVKVIRNSLNQKQIEVSEKCLNKKKHNGFRIGYFSGSPTHVRDFRLIESELISFLDKYQDVELEVVGYMEFSNQMKKLIDEKRVKVTDAVDYLKLQKLIAEVDVNIAPLVINDFTNCKSELKFFEAAAVETTTIASPTYTFKKAIKNGENGFLAHPGEWYSKLEYLYKHPEENKKIAKRAHEYALKHYYGKEFLKEVEKVYDYFAK